MRLLIHPGGLVNHFNNNIANKVENVEDARVARKGKKEARRVEREA